MQLTVTGRHVEVTEAMKEHARRKLERIALDCPRILGAHLIMDIEKYRHRAEVVLQGPHLTITCSRETSDMYGSIDQVMHCVEGQLKRYKDRTQAHKPRHAREQFLSLNHSLNHSLSLSLSLNHSLSLSLKLYYHVLQFFRHI